MPHLLSSMSKFFRFNVCVRKMEVLHLLCSLPPDIQNNVAFFARIKI